MECDFVGVIWWGDEDRGCDRCGGGISGVEGGGGF